MDIWRDAWHNRLVITFNCCCTTPRLYACPCRAAITDEQRQAQLQLQDLMAKAKNDVDVPMTPEQRAQTSTIVRQHFSVMSTKNLKTAPHQMRFCHMDFYNGAEWEKQFPNGKFTAGLVYRSSQFGVKKGAGDAKADTKKEYKK